MRIPEACAAWRFALPSIYVAFAALAMPAAVVPAPVSAADPDAAFAISDRNSDGFIDRGEFHQRMVEVFFFTDRNRDGRLVPAELPGVPEAVFKAADRNGDGTLGLGEFTQARTVDFNQADRDGDGLLSRAEAEAGAGR
jgi:hypothetical protein